MKLSLIQSNCSAINSVYIYREFLHDLNYLNLLSNKISQFTIEKNQLDYQTNVIAKMTDWKKLLTDEDFNFLHIEILQTLYNTINLRNPSPNARLKLVFTDSWGMSHSEGDHTVDHIHGLNEFSGAFYFDVPCETKMWFEDYQEDTQLESNMLVLFSGMTKHRVSKHFGEKKRISMGFNISITNIKD